MLNLTRLSAKFSASDLGRRWAKLIGAVEDHPCIDHGRDWHEDRTLRHDPEVQRLTMLLTDWDASPENQDDQAADLHENLIAMDEAAKLWRSVNAPMLYHAFVPTDEQKASLRDTGKCVLHTPIETPLTTWSKSLFAAFERVALCPRPWMILTKQTKELDIFLDFGSFYSDIIADPSRYEEVIVQMPPKMTVARTSIPLTHDIDWESDGRSNKRKTRKPLF